MTEIAVNLARNIGDANLVVRLYDGSTLVAEETLQEVVGTDGRFVADVSGLDESVAHRVVVLKDTSVIYDDWILSDTAGKPARVLEHLTQMVDPVGPQFTEESLEKVILGGGVTKVRFLVEDENGTPVSGAQLYISGRTLTSKTDGVAELMLNPSPDPYPLRVIASPAYGQVTGLEVVVGADDFEFPVVLERQTFEPLPAPYVLVNIPIIDERGDPAPDVEVTFKFRGYLPEIPDEYRTGVVLSPLTVATSDQFGVVQVKLLRLANYKATYVIEEITRNLNFSTEDVGDMVIVEGM